MVTLNIDYVHREGCHLCDDYLAQLIAFSKKHNVQFVQKDVDSNHQLYERYNVDVPAVVLNGVIINKHFFDENELLKGLSLPLPRL